MPDLTELRNILPESSRSWLIAAMRQDIHIWKHLLKYLDSSKPTWQELQDAHLAPEEWSPAALALAALNQPPNPKPLRDLAALPLELRQRAGRAFEYRTQPRSAITIETQTDLAEAGLLAIALRERRRLIGTWDNLTDELQLAPPKTWYTPLACLFGMIPDPKSLLTALIGDGSKSTWNRLALHALLSNPQPPEEQGKLLLAVIPHHATVFLEQLAMMRPELAQTVTNTYQASHHLENIQLAIITANPDKILESLSHAENELRRAHANLASQNAKLLKHFDLADSETVLEHWRQAMALEPNEPIYRAGLANELLDNGQTAEAISLLQACTHPQEHPDLLFALTQLATRTGDKERARRLAIQTLQTIERRQASGDLASRLSAIGGLLLELGRPLVAAQAFEQALRYRPTDTSLLSLLSQARLSANDISAALENIELAVLLEPQNITLRRQFAVLLESTQNWQSALNERIVIASHHPANNEEIDVNISVDKKEIIDDYQALAKCALQCKQPQHAIQACQKALSFDPENGFLHAQFGEALITNGDKSTAIEQFTLATLISPELPRPWLALAQIFNANGETQKTIETLRAAIKAVPKSAEIHLTLGETYLSANAPTQALESLRRAAEIEPDNKHISLPLGQVLHRLGYLEEARKTLETAFDGESSPPELAYSYAQVLLALGELANALEPLEYTVTVQPTNAAAYLDYACTLLSLKKKLPKAIDALKHIIANNPEMSAAQAFLAEALVETGELSTALETYQKALETDLSSDDTWRGRISFGLGKTALALQHGDTAIAALHEASQVDPTNPQIYRALTDAYLLVGLQKNSLQAMRAVLHITNDDIEALLWFANKAETIAALETQESREKGIYHHQDTALKEARQALQKAIHLAPERPDLHLRLADLHIQLSEPDAARKVLLEIQEHSSTQPTDLQQAAHYLQTRLNDPNNAITCLKRALELSNNPNEIGENLLLPRHELLKQMASAQKDAGNPHEALKSIDQALENADEISIASLSDEKIHLLLELQRPEDALTCIEETLVHQPKNFQMHLLAASILQTAGNLSKAIHHAERAIPSNDWQARYLAADLVRAILQFERGCGFLRNQKLPPLCQILYAELALENEAEVDAAEALTQAIKQISIEETASNPFLRGCILTLQARMTLRRGDPSAANDLYQQAQEVLLMSTTQDEDDMLLRLLTIAAVELERWDEALQMARQEAGKKQHEPYSQLQLGRVLVLRAERQRLCAKAQVVAHAPNSIAIAATSRREFERAIERGKEITKQLFNKSGESKKLSQEIETQASEAFQKIEQWEERGKMVFLANDESDKKQIYPHQIASVLTDQTKTHPQEALITAQVFIQASQAEHTSQKAIAHYFLANTAFWAGEHSTAIDSIQIALGLWTDEPRWHELAGNLDLATENALHAIEHFEQAIELEPSYANHYLGLGQAYLNLRSQHTTPKEVEELALQAFRKATKLDPNQSEAWYTQALAQMNAGELERAAKSATQAIKLVPQKSDYLLLYAQIALRRGDPEQALEHARSVLKYQPTQSTALLIAARALQSLNRSGEALALLERYMMRKLPSATEAKPEDTKPISVEKNIPLQPVPLALQLERIKVLVQTHGPQSALSAAEMLAQTHTHSPPVLATLAHIQAESGEHEAAIHTAQTALKMVKKANQKETEDEKQQPEISANELANLHHLLGSLLRRAGQLDQAVHHLSQAIYIDPNHLEAYIVLGLAQQERRQYHPAQIAYQQAIAIAPQDPRPYLQAGLAFKDGKNYVEAENMLRKAAELAPKDVSIRRQLAAVVALNLVHNRRRIGSEAATEELVSEKA